jgi:anti-sigma factor RsiW
MKAHNSELISALVDGELKGVRRWLVQRHVNRCASCATDYRRLQQVREMLAANPVTLAMSDSPEFFWSKVKREIQAREVQTADVPVPAPNWSDWLGQHRYAFATAATLVVAVGLVFALQTPRKADGPVVIIASPVAQVEHASTFIHNTVVTTFDATESEPAVIWVSGLPWTPDMTEMKTHFAQWDS